MTRFSRSEKKTLRVSDVLADHNSSLGGLLKRASFLMQLEHLLAGCLDPGLAAHFQVATIHGKRIILIAPGASWATQLRMQAPQLLRALHQAGCADIEHVDIRVAPLVSQPANSRRKKTLSPAAKQALEHMGRLAADEED